MKNIQIKYNSLININESKFQTVRILILESVLVSNTLKNSLIIDLVLFMNDIIEQNPNIK